MINETTSAQEYLRRYCINTGGPFSDDSITTRISNMYDSVQTTHWKDPRSTYRTPEETSGRMIPEYELRAAVAREVKFAVAEIIQKITDAVGELSSKEQVYEFLAEFQESMRGE